MAKDKSEKKDKKEKKEKRSETEGVKKEKKEKKSRSSDATTALLNELETQKPGSVAVDADGDVIVADVNGAEDTGSARAQIPKEALVPFANPLADEKQTKKILKSVKKAAKNKTLKRGVKEVVKSLRKSPTNQPASSNVADPSGVVVIAADISPMDVISHLPVLCEDHNVPYIYVTSRAELGVAGSTKRPTSVVMVSKDRQTKAGAKALDKTDEQKEFEETYSDLVKLVKKAGASVRV